MAKVINFGLIYGMSAFGLAQQLGLDRKVAAAYVERYFQRFPGVRRYMDETRARAAEDGYVETVFGRRLWIPDIRSSRPMVRAGAERAPSSAAAPTCAIRPVSAPKITAAAAITVQTHAIAISSASLSAV